MEKIKSFGITRLSLRGFKKFAEPKEFHFGNMTSITGHNSQGKTSIAEAIAYAITGVPYFGGERSLDRLYTIDTKDVMVALEIEADGEKHELVRLRSYDTTTITYDGIQITQGELTTMFGEKDLFLSIFNPLYFVEILEDKGRNLLERYLPAIPREQVMERLSEAHREILKGANMSSPESLLANTREEIRELNNELIYAEGQYDLLVNLTTNKAATIKAKTAEVAEAQSAVNELERKRAEGLDFKAMNERRSDLYARYDELSKDSEATDTSEVDAEIAKTTRLLEQRRAEQYMSKFAKDIADVSAALVQKSDSYKQETAVYEALRPDIQCPTCKQTVTEQNLSDVKKAFAVSINAIAAEGKELTAKLRELQELDAKALAVFEQFKADDIEKHETSLNELKAGKERLLSEKAGNTRRDVMSTIKAEIQSLESDIENGNLSPEEMAELTSLKGKAGKMQAELDALSTQENQSPKEKGEFIDRLRQSVAAKQELEEAVKAYITERIEITFSSFDMLQHVGIQIYEPIKKTGEVKNVFRCSYDGKPYKFLSYCEKIKAGLEISELMKKLTNSCYPVFIDNGESVPVIDNIRPTGQVFISQVVKKAPLTVSILDAPAEPKAAA